MPGTSWAGAGVASKESTRQAIPSSTVYFIACLFMMEVLRVVFYVLPPPYPLPRAGRVGWGKHQARCGSHSRRTIMPTGAWVHAAIFHRFKGGTTVLKKSLIIAAVVAPVAVVSAVAQQSAIKRTPLQTVDFPAGYNVVSAIAEIAPGNCAGRHTHPGVESSYVMEGGMVLKVLAYHIIEKGKPLASPAP